MTPTEYNGLSQPITTFFNQSRRGSQQSNYSFGQPSPSPSRWKGFSLPSWSRRGSQSNSGGATEEEVIAAMKEANRRRRGSLMLAEDEQGEDEKGNRFSQLYSSSNESVDFNYGNVESAFQFSSFYRGGDISQSNRSSARYSGHRQQDSVSSMQQFYHIPQHGRESSEGSLRYYSSDYHVDQQDRSQQQQSYYSRQEQQFYEHKNLSTVMEAADHGEEIDMPISMSTIQQPQHYHGQSQYEEKDIHPLELRNQNQLQNHRIPITHKATTKLTSQQQQQQPLHHSHTKSDASNSTLSSTESCSPIVNSHSRTGSGITTHQSIATVSAAVIAGTPRRFQTYPQPPSPSSPLSPSTLATATPSLCSSAVTLNCARRRSSSPSTTLKLRVPDNMTTTMAMSVRQPRDQNLHHISIDMAGNSNNINTNTSIITTNNNGPSSDDGLAPPSPESCISQSTTSATLVAMATANNVATTETAKGDNNDGDVAQECGGHSGVEEDYREPLFPCLLPDWETFKSGLLPTSKHAREALLATVILALVTIALEAILLQRHGSMTARLTEAAGPYEISFFRPLTVYYYIFILAEVFAVGLLWDAAIHKNSLQLVAFTLFEWCMVSYSGLQIWQHDQLYRGIGVPADVLDDLGDSNTRIILFSQLGVQVTACTGITLLTSRLYSEFGWLVFQKLGADVSLRKMMKEYRLLFTLLKLDAFFFFGYAIQVAALTDTHWQRGLTEIAFAIPLSAVIILLGFYAMRNENKVTMSGFIACLVLLIGYMTYRIVALYQTLTGERSTDPYFFCRKTMTVFAALTLFIAILALINAIVMLYNFNKGLKEAMRQYRVRRSVTPSLHRMSVNGDGSICNSGGESLGPGTPKPGPASVRGIRNPKRSSRRSLIHYDKSTSTLVTTERWEIE